MIYIFDEIGNNKRVINGTGKLKNLLSDVDFSKALILKQGHRLTEDYEVKENDIIFVRIVAGAIATGTLIALIVGGISLLVGAVGIGIGLNNSQIARKEVEKAQKDAKNLSQKNEQLPFLKGAKNRNALGQVIQYVIGNSYNTPYFLTDSYYSIKGNLGKEQYYNCVLSCGYSNQIIKSLSCGSVKIKDFIEKDIASQNKIYTTDFIDSIYKKAIQKIEINNNGNFTSDEYKQKVKGEQIGSEIKKEEPLFYKLSEYTKTVEACIQFNGLRQYNSNFSTYENATATIISEWSNDNGATWQRLGNFEGSINNKFVYNQKDAIRFKVTKTFTYEEVYNKDIQLRFRNVTPKKDDSNITDTCYLLYVNQFCYDNSLSNENDGLIDCYVMDDVFNEKVTKIGITIKADDNTKDILDEFNVISSGIARTFENDDVTFEETSNPVSWVFDILTSKFHKHSQFTENEIDLNSFKRAYEYCKENNFRVDGIVTQATKKVELLKKILTTINANLFINTENKIEIAIDKEEENPVALLNSQCIKEITINKSLERKADGVKVSFTNRDAWAIDTFYSMKQGERTQDSVLLDLTTEFVTTYEHAYKMSQRKLREQNLQPREITVEVGKDGDYYPLFARVLLQVPQLRQGLANAEIKNVIVNSQTGKISGLIISDYFNFDDSKNYGAIIQAVTKKGRQLYYRKIFGNGETKDIFFEEEIEYTDLSPEAGNILSIGYISENGKFDTITNDMKIYGISRTAEGVTLTLKDYNSSLYEFGTIPEYKSNLTLPPKKQGEIVETVSKTENEEYIKNQIVVNSTKYQVQQLSSLNTTNVQEGKIDVYMKNMYIYKGGQWVLLDAGVYLGKWNSVPYEAGVKSYFLAADNFTANFKITTSKGIISTTDNLMLTTSSIEFHKGFIYVRENDGWHKVEDKTDHRYVIAVEDLLSINEKPSYHLENYVKEEVADKTPIYKGALAEFPLSANTGDWFAFIGESYDTYIKGTVYTWNGLKWVVDTNSAHNIEALDDLLLVSDTNASNFANVFCEHLAENSAFIEKLTSNTTFIEKIRSIIANA